MNSRIRTPWKQAVEIQAMSDYQLWVIFEDGEQLQLDLKTLIMQHDSLWQLRSENYFKKVSLDPLGALCWPEGEDLSPVNLKQYAQTNPHH